MDRGLVYAYSELFLDPGPDEVLIWCLWSNLEASVASAGSSGLGY